MPTVMRSEEVRLQCGCQRPWEENREGRVMRQGFVLGGEVVVEMSWDHTVHTLNKTLCTLKLTCSLVFLMWFYAI